MHKRSQSIAVCSPRQELSGSTIMMQSFIEKLLKEVANVAKKVTCIQSYHLGYPSRSYRCNEIDPDLVWSDRAVRWL